MLSFIAAFILASLAVAACAKASSRRFFTPRIFTVLSSVSRLASNSDTFTFSACVSATLLPSVVVRISTPTGAKSCVWLFFSLWFCTALLYRSGFSNIAWISIIKAWQINRASLEGKRSVASVLIILCLGV